LRLERECAKRNWIASAVAVTSASHSHAAESHRQKPSKTLAKSHVKPPYAVFRPEINTLNHHKTRANPAFSHHSQSRKINRDTVKNHPLQLDKLLTGAFPKDSL
jgi:hypothetical protein